LPASQRPRPAHAGWYHLGRQPPCGNRPSGARPGPHPRDAL